MILSTKTGLRRSESTRASAGSLARFQIIDSSEVAPHQQEDQWHGRPASGAGNSQSAPRIAPEARGVKGDLEPGMLL